MNYFNKYLRVVSFALFFILYIFVTLFSFQNYIGSGLLYCVFTISFTALLLSAFIRPPTYGYTFLCVFLWLGFWNKISFHIVFAYPYREPIGHFDGSPESWDKILMLACLGALGVLGARLIYGLFFKKEKCIEVRAVSHPRWYPQLRTKIWVYSFLFIILISALNAILGICQSGLYPETVLLWPLNAVIGWLLVSGLSMGIAALSMWELAFNRNVKVPFLFVLFTAFLTSTSLISRGAYIFQVVPQLYSFVKNTILMRDLSIRKTLVAFIIFALVTTVTLFSITLARNHFYSKMPLPIFKTSSGWQLVGALKQLFGELPFVVQQLSPLLVDRWIGPEGLMSISSHPDLGWTLLKDIVQEHPVIGKQDMYQGIARSIYPDSPYFNFISLPGPIAFWYYAGKTWLVPVGMFCMSFFILFLELLVFRALRNPFLCSAFGVFAANAVAQFGLIPRLVPKHFALMFFGFLFLWFTQSIYCTRMLIWLGLFKEENNEVVAQKRAIL